MRTINLLSFTSIQDKDVRGDLIKVMGLGCKDNDLLSINSFCNFLRENKVHSYVMNDFYVGFSIPQISKEFDLLRVGNYIINIELKAEYNYEKILKQLRKNSYYLKFLGKDMHLYTYCAKENKLYMLCKDELIESEFTNLISKLESQTDIFCDDLNTLFEPSNYLVSPFNSTERFLSDEYFLTSQQEEITDEILKNVGDNKTYIFSIQGVAGTGKSLLLYHIAKKIGLDQVIIYHIGNLNEGHCLLRKSGWNIEPIKGVNYANYHQIVLVDEAQRLKKSQIDEFIKSACKYSKTLILCHDTNQTLSKGESENLIDIIDRLNTVLVRKYELTKKVRTNKELANFINTILGKTKMNIPLSKNANITYFDDVKEAYCYIMKKTQGRIWKYITHTPSLDRFRMSNKTDDMLLNANPIGTAHKVIGQEFDNVITFIDDSFYYNEKGLLYSSGVKNNENCPYLRYNGFFQAITRVIKRLEIVVVKNIPVYKRMIEMFKIEISEAK